MAPKKTLKKTVTARKKPAGTRTSNRKSPQNRAAGELISILDKLDTDEITWLTTQAKTMVYNHKVEEVNKAARSLADSKKKTVTKKQHTDSIDIVQAGGPKSFNILMGNARLFINLEELKSMVKIAVAAKDSGDGAGRLYRWCSKERSDILIDGGISSPADPGLKEIYSILKDRFTVG